MLNSRWRSDNLMSLNSRWQFGNILLLSSNDRICSFNWTRGSKNCFLTIFSNLYRYFYFLVFSQNCYLLVSLHLSWLHGTPISHPIYIPFVLWITRRTCAPIFLVHITPFLEVRCSWEPDTRVSTGILSPFRLLPKVSRANARLGDCESYLFFSSKSSNWHFLPWHKPPQSQRSTARERDPKGISKLVNKVDFCLSDNSCWTTFQAFFALDRIPDGSLHFGPFNSADLPHYKILHSGFLNVPLPFGMLLEVSPNGCHTFDWL